MQLTAGDSFPLAGDRVQRTTAPFSIGLARHTSTVDPSMFLPKNNQSHKHTYYSHQPTVFTYVNSTLH